MAGINEILVLILIIAGILILPRLFKPQPAHQSDRISFGDKIKNLSVKSRAAISLSIVYPIAMALYLTPWSSNLALYLLLGVLPIIIAWALFWILSGSKNA